MSRFKIFLSTLNFSSTTMLIIFVILTAVWLFNLHVFYRIKNQAAFITVGMLGMFVLMMVFVRPIATMPLARIVAALAGFVGRLTGTFIPYFKYGILFIETKQGSITLQIDFECSGIIEIMVYLSILAFFRVYSVSERAILSAIGVIYIIVANAMRIIIISVMIHFGGPSMYYIAHTYVGRIFFYAATIVLYFYVFTKSQVVRMKVGSFSYDKDKDKSKENDKTGEKDKTAEKDKTVENGKNVEKDKAVEEDKAVEKGKIAEKDKAVEKDKTVVKVNTAEKDKTVEKDKTAEKDKTIEKDNVVEKNNANKKDQNGDKGKDNVKKTESKKE